MRAVVQRVKKAAVHVDSEVVGSIGSGFVVFLGVGQDDTAADAHYLADKIAGLRILGDAHGRMNESLRDQDAEALVISQFTLYGDCRRGRRPSFSSAAPPDTAETLYSKFTQRLSSQGISTATGVFQAHMQVELVNDGPVTMLLESKGAF